jgi:hypothetical protein
MFLKDLYNHMLLPYFSDKFYSFRRLQKLLYESIFASTKFKQIEIMKTHFLKPLSLFGVLALALISCDKDDNNDYPTPPQTPQATVLSASGDSSSIIGAINQFRSLLGDPLNTTPGKSTGRREVNWDAVPAAFTNKDGFPFDFFNSTIATDPDGRKRGLILTPGVTTFRVDSTDFSEIDASYNAAFNFFSRTRTFANTASTITEVTFKVPGTNTDAFVNGFGLVFSDVDDANSTMLEFFDGYKSLGVFKAPAGKTNGDFSFLGVHFKYDKVTRVKITSGNETLRTGVKDVSDGGSADVVIMDDFFYSEPNSIQ